MRKFNYIFKFGYITDKSIIYGLFIVSSILYITIANRPIWGTISYNSTDLQVIRFNIFIFYRRYMEDILILILFKLILEYMYKVLNKYND